MALRDTLGLYRAGRPVRTFPLGAAPVEVGSHPEADIVIHASGVPARALLIQPHGGSVYLYDLAKGPALRTRSVMPIGERVRLSADYSIVRLKAEPLPSDPGGTEPLRPEAVGATQLSLVRGHGPSARAFHVGASPVSIGGARDNALTLSDRAVSQYHCRLEPSPRGVWVRDLGSTNGTWVDGLRVRRHQLRPGAVVRVGRSELRVVGRSPKSSAGVVVASSAMLSVMADVDRLASLPWPALVQGETGVGKEHIARALHERGRRKDGPFVPLNGGGLARNLIESELFGHERGAFTGAVQARRGAFERADGGTLFLDEVAELPPDLQTRLLRVLETWEVRRVGGEVGRPVDVRLVCATHQDLRRLVQEGLFRPDLFYRIHRLVIEVPPLRARPDDIECLAEHFLQQMESAVGERRLDPQSLGRLRAYPWPGNARELRNVLELAAVDCDGSTIDLATLNRTLRRVCDPVVPHVSSDSLRETVEQYGGNLSAAARALGIPRSTLRDRLRSAPGGER